MLFWIAPALFFPAADPPRLTTNAFHVWSTYAGDHPFHGKWAVHLEASVRRANLLTTWTQSRYRTQLNYDKSQNVQFSFGYLFGKTYPNGAQRNGRINESNHTLVLTVFSTQPFTRKK